MQSTAAAMVGARAGDRVAVLGAPGTSGAALAAELGTVTGLNGRTVVVDTGSEPRDQVEAAAAKAGTLVEFTWAPVTMVPLDSESFDVVVIHGQLADLAGQNRIACCGEALRLIVRPKGRVVVIEGLRRPGLFGLLPSRRPGLPAPDVRDALTAAGASAVRQLAEVDSICYWEAK